MKSVKKSESITIPLHNETNEAHRNVSKTSSNETLADYARGANATVTNPREFESVSSKSKGLNRTSKMTTTSLNNSKKGRDKPMYNIRDRIEKLKLQKNRNTAFKGTMNGLQENQGFIPHRGRYRSHEVDGPDINRVNVRTKVCLLVNLVRECIAFYLTS